MHCTVYIGIGTAAGWRYPIGTLMDRDFNVINVKECNAVVKTVSDYFGNMCLPGALTSFYNPFGKCSHVHQYGSHST